MMLSAASRTSSDITSTLNCECRWSASVTGEERKVSKRAFRPIPKPGSCSRDPDNRRRRCRNRSRRRDLCRFSGSAISVSVAGADAAGSAAVSMEAARRPSNSKPAAASVPSGRDSRLRRRRAVHGLENGLIGRLRGPLRFEDGLHFFGRQLLDAVDRFFQNRILGDLLRDHVLQLQAVQLKDRHHLDESGRQDLLLRDLQLQSGRKHRHL